MAYFKSIHCTADEHHRCVDGTAAKCVCPCHREAAEKSWQEDEAEMDRRIIDGLGLTYDPAKKMLVKKAS